MLARAAAAGPAVSLASWRVELLRNCHTYTASSEAATAHQSAAPQSPAAATSENTRHDQGLASMFGLLML